MRMAGEFGEKKNIQYWNNLNFTKNVGGKKNRMKAKIEAKNYKQNLWPNEMKRNATKKNDVSCSIGNR